MISLNKMNSPVSEITGVCVFKTKGGGKDIPLTYIGDYFLDLLNLLSINLYQVLF